MTTAPERQIGRDPREVTRRSQASKPWPSVSIVVPTFQRREIVCEAVRALARLHYSGPLEVIVVVDGSADGTAAALSSVECPWPMRVLEQPNLGASAARNRGAVEARHEILLFLDDDMIAEPDLVEQHARLHIEGAGAVIGHAPVEDPHSSRGFLPKSVARGFARSRIHSPLSPFDIFTGQLSVRRSVFRDIGGFDPALTSAQSFGNEDADFGAELLGRCEVRYNAAAITRQRYSVAPREYLQRARRAAAADLHFSRKRPELAKELFELKGASRPITRFLYLPLARVPLVLQLLSVAATSLAEIALKTPLHSNRLLARLFSGARAALYWSTLRSSGWSAKPGRVLVLCYHAIRDDRDDTVLGPYSVPRDLFLRQLDGLTKRGFSFISPDELAAFLTRGAPLPRRPVLLTFDDGYADLLDLFRSELSRHGIKPLVFAVSGLQTNEWDRASGAPVLELLSDEQLRQAASLGIEVGSHSRTHQLLTKLDDEQLRSEVGGSVAELERKGLPRPRFFAYPYGARNLACIDAVTRAGFLAAFGPKQKLLGHDAPMFDLPRLQIVAADRGLRFRFKTAAPATFTWLDRVRESCQARLRLATRFGRHAG
jgi:glycosyltransferase involved in cell wall biosynthesis/peptidoglycan/xylan/chitin deacetylase (PgdA/CDA1 family)